MKQFTVHYKTKVGRRFKFVNADTLALAHAEVMAFAPGALIVSTREHPEVMPFIKTLAETEADAFPTRGCVGSLQWGIDRGRAFDVEGLQRHGVTVTSADGHRSAAEFALSYCLWDDEAFTFIAPKVLTVWQIGPRDYMRSNVREFRIQNGVVVPIKVDDSALRCQECGTPNQFGNVCWTCREEATV